MLMKYDKICENCGGAFQHYRERTRFCSKSCVSSFTWKKPENARQLVQKPCHYCKDEFTWDSSFPDRIYCTRRCALLHRNEVNWTDDEFRSMMSEAVSRSVKARWENSEFKEKMRSVASNTLTTLWADPAYRPRLIEAAKASYEANRDKVGLNGFGHYHVIDTVSGPIACRSKIEAAFVRSIEDQGCSDIIAEPAKIPYTWDGRDRNYYPDFFYNLDGDFFLVEVKYSNAINDPQNLAKWEAAREYCTKNGYTFYVATEKGIYGK